MKKALTSVASTTRNAVNRTQEFGREIRQGASEMYHSTFLRGLGITVMSQQVSSWLVTRLYEGDPEKKDVLEAEAVFIAPLAFFTGRGMRRILDWARVPEHRARQIITWTNPVVAISAPRFAADLATNPQSIEVTDIASAAEYVVAAGAHTVQGLPNAYFEEGAVTIPAAVVGTVGAVNGMTKPPRQKH